MSNSPIIVWIRKDLRLIDNPSLYHAALEGNPVIPVFIWAPSEEGNWCMGEAQQWWLHHSLHAFASTLETQGLKLIVRRGPSESTLFKLAQETGAQTVYWNKVYEPIEAQRDQQTAHFLEKNEIEVIQWDGQILHDPTEISTKSGTPYKVFTPFWRNLKEHLRVPLPLEKPTFKTGSNHLHALSSLAIEELQLLPSLDWAKEFPEYWNPGEETAHNRLRRFTNKAIKQYDHNRDYPAVDGTSRLSPHLCFGEISARTLWHEIVKGPVYSDVDDEKAPFLRQLIWREFAYHLIRHFPHTRDQNLRNSFDLFPWSANQEHLDAWKKGRTGYPIVDAGMRQLWRVGWMHNRVRMIVASFLTKHLLIHWLEGAQWFWDTLVDANLPNNTLGWQWAAGSGADAQPFFRIFNPISQGKKFDVDGQYIRTWVPELQKVPNSVLHEPWLMSDKQQQKSCVILGKDYPQPIVDHKEARESALAAYDTISK